MLEGDKEDVVGLYEKIKGDYRHKNVKTLLEAETEERRFPSWSMAFSIIPNADSGFEWLQTLLLVQAGTKDYQDLVDGLSDNSMIASGP